ncbi:Cysteine desulfurase IscS [Caprobacter fermentans]|uniref:cysteine desulfurase n=1 Tax=Caproicibacter fermentans TaxID=2576756 RepID=A0A6N8I4Z8_9FIRM|nr:IscS subfamily cysteine desulfurase [Caproicibacter fermentans]MVB12847.1 Cysteine desulfurase IscS [Caproicibacter fermentans]QNK41393.1 IscS subfamily cysteine desulfurase [Caproicibacter fermentans]
MIYADNAATTPVSDSVLQAMLPYFSKEFGNPSSLYASGRRAKRALESARETVADCLDARPDEIFFTSGGSESDNWAIKMSAKKGKETGKTHLITSEFEHHAVLHSLRSLESGGFTVSALSVHEDGIIRPEELKAALRPETALVTVMTANNEIGTIQPISEIGALCRGAGIPLHTDAVQAAGILPLDVKAMNVDFLSLSAHKFHGPKGVGALYIRKGAGISGLMDGGAQERGLRAGTENVAGIVGLAVALKEACENRKACADRLTAMRDRLIQGALKIPGTRLNGDPVKRLPGNVNLSFEQVEGEALLLLLDQNGICASAGSACTAGSLEPSHVLRAIGLSEPLAHGSLRLTLSCQNTEAEVDEILQILPDVIMRVRSLSSQ